MAREYTAYKFHSFKFVKVCFTTRIWSEYMFYGHLERMCILLLLGEVLYKYLFDPVD